MNPIIKFTTLFGLLAVEMAVSLTAQGLQGLTWALAAVFLAINMVFVYRSFYGMRIDVEAVVEEEAAMFEPEQEAAPAASSGCGACCTGACATQTS